jgi:hypothetical protein
MMYDVGAATAWPNHTPAPSHTPAPAQEPVPAHDPAAAHIRNLVIERLVRMNARHATHAWLSRRSQPVGPHGVAFLYYALARPSEPEHPAQFTVAAGTRLVDDAEDVRDLPRLLYRLTTLARERYLPDPAGFDPVARMCNRHDPIPAGAAYLGVGVSSLDTADATWDQSRQRATGPLDLPGRCFALLRDGSMLLIERGAQDVFGEVRLVSTHDLNVRRDVSARKWSWLPDLTGIPGTAEIWRQLADLHGVASRQRVTATRGRA